MKLSTLISLYNRTSKHSSYQVLARPLQALIPQDRLNIISRHEIERLEYVLSHCPIEGKTIADIGGNTGFFTMECATRGASHVSYFEGNETHAQFVRAAAQMLQLEKVIAVSGDYVHFRDEFDRRVDMCFLLNVLHHIGDDYGDSMMSRSQAKKAMLASLAYLSSYTRLLVLQLGFNWKGDRAQPLFEHGTKAELIEFIRSGTAHEWDVLHIGIAQRVQGHVEYQDLNENNIHREDSLGEFLNRPLFIMRSRSFYSSPPMAAGQNRTKNEQ